MTHWFAGMYENLYIARVADLSVYWLQEFISIGYTFVRAYAKESSYPNDGFS